MGAITNKFSDIKKNFTIYLMILPNLILFICLVIYPIIWTLGFAFYEYSGLGSTIKFAGLDNFKRLFTRDPLFWRAVLNTFIYASGKIVLTIPVAFLLAVFLNKKQRGSSFLKTVYFMPTIISISVMSLIFYLIFNTYNGTLNIMLKNAGIITESIGWLSKEHAMLTVIIVGAWGGIGNYMVYFLAGLQSIPKEVYESADIDGTNGWQRMFYITLPMMGSVLQFILMLAILIAFQDMQSIMVLTEGGPSSATEVMFLYVYKLFFPISAGEAIPPEYGYGAATGIASSAIVGVFTCIYLYLSRKLNEIY